MAAIWKGDRVEHVDYGEGTVVRAIGPRRVRVQFDSLGALARTVAADQLRVVEVTASADSSSEKAGEKSGIKDGLNAGSKASAPAARSRAPSKAARKAALKAAPKVAAEGPGPSAPPIARSSAWQCLEALRLGVVPSRGTIHYTVGRQKPLSTLLELLGRGTGFHGIFGEYGEGKTHLLDAFEGLSRSEEFAVSRLAVDPQETAVQNPARIWSALSDRLEFRADLGLRAFLEKLKDSDEHVLAGGERFDPILSPALFALRSGDADCVELAMAHARAERVSLEDYRRRLRKAGWSGPAPIHLPDFRTLGGVYVRMLGTVASWARDLGGRGLAVMLDEVERTEALSAQNYGWALEFLQHLAAATLPESDLSFRKEELYPGGMKRHRDLAKRFEDDQPLVVVAAMTPLDSTLKSFWAITKVSEHATHLAPLGDGVVGDLVAGIATVYRAAYPDFAFDASLLETIAAEVLEERAMGMSSFRRTVRSAVAHLDAARLQASRQEA